MAAGVPVGLGKSERSEEASQRLGNEDNVNCWPILGALK